MPVGESESGESGKRPGELLLVGLPFRQLEPHLATTIRGQFLRYPEKPPANGTGHFLCGFTTKDLFLEPVHQVVGQHDQLKIEPSTCPMPRNTLVQAESVNALLDKVLTAGTPVVNPPDLLARSLAVGGNYLVITVISDQDRSHFHVKALVEDKFEYASSTRFQNQAPLDPAVEILKTKASFDLIPHNQITQALQKDTLPMGLYA